MIDTVVDFVTGLDLLKVGGILAAPVALGIAYPLAKRRFKDMLDTGAETIKNLRHELRLKEQHIAADAVRIAQLMTDNSAKQTLIEHKDAQIRQLNENYAKIYKEGKRLYGEYHRLKPFEAKATTLEADAVRLTSELENSQREVARLNDQIVNVDSKLLDAGKRFIAAEKRFKRAMKTEGQLWNAKAYKSRPKFVPLLERKCAVLSLLNLKGGVGKTTTAAHLAATFAQRGYRVLLVDLDLQGSLTTLLVPGEVRDQRFDAKLMLKDFLQHMLMKHRKAPVAPAVPPLPGMSNGQHADKPSGLGAYAVRVVEKLPCGGSVDVIPTTDMLALAELSMNINWLLRSGERDARFLLRKALHSRQVTKNYDMVILDCPPLLNISCINALAATDYIIIPALPSLKSLERVPKLLETIVSAPFRENINHDLRVLGLLANRTGPSGLSIEGGNQWNQQAQRIANIQNFSLNRLKTFIPQTKEVQDAEQDFTPSELDSTLGEAYHKLAQELEGALPYDCRRTAQLSS